MAAQSQIHPISCSVVTVCFCVWAKKHRTDVLKHPTNSQNLATIFKPSSSCRVSRNSWLLHCPRRLQAVLHRWSASVNFQKTRWNVPVSGCLSKKFLSATCWKILHLLLSCLVDRFPNPKMEAAVPEWHNSRLDLCLNCTSTWWRWFIFPSWYSQLCG